MNPEVGMGATKMLRSDRCPFTIVEVLGPKEIVVQQDDARRVDGNGFSEQQIYEYTPNPRSVRITLTLRKNGHWVEKGDEMYRGSFYVLGERQAYYDPSF